MIGAGEGNTTRTNPAILTVNPTISRVTATPAPSAEVAVSPTPVINPVTATAPVTSAVTTPSDAQAHSYADTWSYDARGHWRESLDGSPATDEALHSFTWTTTQDESGAEVETGVCDVCGYTSIKRHGGSVAGTAAQDGSAGVPTPVQSSSDSGSSSGGFSLSALKPPSALMALLMALLPVDLILVIVHLCGPAKQRRRKRRRR